MTFLITLSFETFLNQLELIYIVYKTNVPYDKNYLKKTQLAEEGTEVEIKN